ncbi:MAG: FG-GAP repeat protein [Nanoarchaeota archaeon]|nr:FG-GAP repeat protein [Nanoarchaeota archaeon]
MKIKDFQGSNKFEPMKLSNASEKGLKISFSKKLCLYLVLALLLMSGVSAIGYFSERMNFPPGESREHRQVLTNDGSSAIQINATVPSGFSVSATDCNQLGSVISCDLAVGASKYYTLSSPAIATEGTTYKSYLTSNNSFSADFTFVCIPDNKITDCKVEYGHGDANYLSNNQLYVSNETVTLFNLLRVWNIGHYLSPNEAAENASMRCTYENYPVRTYGRVEIDHGVSEVNGTFLWTKIESGYWFRIGVVSQDVGGKSVGDFYNVSCGNLTYQFDHHQVVAESSVCNLEIRDTEPFSCSVAAHPTLSGKLILTLTNNEKYSVYDISFDKTLNSVEHTETYWQLNSGRGISYVIDNGTEDDVDLFFIPSWYINSWSPQYYTQQLDCSNVTAGVNNPPTLLSNIPDQSWLRNTNKTNAFDLDDYFVDPNGDSLTYTYTQPDNITIVVDGNNVVSFIPDINFSGTRYIIFYANDSTNVTASNNVTLHLYYCGDGTCDATESCSSCSADCGTCPPAPTGGGGGGGGRAIPPVEEEEPPLELEELPIFECLDGTFYGECSFDIPKYCADGVLIDRCSVCGCLEGFECEEDKCVEIPVELLELPLEIPLPPYFLNPDILDEEFKEEAILDYSILYLYYDRKGGPGFLEQCVIPEEYIWRKIEEFLNFKVLDEEFGEEAILDYSLLTLFIEEIEIGPVWGACNWIYFCRLVVVLSVLLLLVLIPILVRRVKEETEIEYMEISHLRHPYKKKIVREAKAKPEMDYIKLKEKERCLLGDIPEYPRPGKRKQFYVVYILLFLILSIGGLMWTYPASQITGAAVYSPDFGITAGAVNASINYSYYEEENGSKLGIAMVSADLNQDNLTDYIISAPLWNNGDGKVYAIYRPLVDGSHNISMIANVTWNGSTTNESLGYSMAVGDVDNNTYPDLLIGARWLDDPFIGFNEVGGAFLIYNYGNMSGDFIVNETSNVTFYGGASNDEAGYSVAIGDLDGDLDDDVVIGAPGVAGNGKIYINFGPIASNNNYNLVLSQTEYSTLSGYRLGSELVVDDINNDGIDDILVGAEFGNRIYLLLGPIPVGVPLDIDATANMTLNISTAGRVGRKHSFSTGDVNNDGYKDILIGAPFDNLSGGTNTGRVFLVYGNSTMNGTVNLNDTYPQWTAEGIDDLFGYSVELYDANGDGYDDVFIGAPYRDEGVTDTGKVYLFYANFSNTTYNAANANESWYGYEKNMMLGLLKKGTMSMAPVWESAISSTLFSVGFAPVVDFTSSATTVTVGTAITFTDLSTNNPDTWAWNFGGGGTPNTDTGQNPVITWNTAGTYTVTLTASNTDGSDTETKVGYIIVNPVPVVVPPSPGGGGPTLSSTCTISGPLTVEFDSIVRFVVYSERDATFVVDGLDYTQSTSGKGSKVFEFLADQAGTFVADVYLKGLRNPGCSFTFTVEEEKIPGVMEIVVPKQGWPGPINTFSRQGKRLDDIFTCETRPFESENALKSFIVREMQTENSLTGALSYSGDDFFFAWNVVEGDSEITYGFVNEDGFDSNPWLEAVEYKEIIDVATTGDIVSCPGMEADYMFVSNDEDEIRFYFDDVVTESVLEIFGQRQNGRNVVLRADVRELSVHEIVEETSGPFKWEIEIGEESYSGYFNSPDVRYVLNTDTGKKWVELAEGAVFNIKTKVPSSEGLIGKSAFVKLGDDAGVVEIET